MDELGDPFEEAVAELLAEARAQGVSEDDIAAALELFARDLENWADGPVEDDGDEDGPRFTEEQVRADAAESCELAWRELLGDESLDPDVLAAAVELVHAGGCSGVPGMFMMFYEDPREALAQALPEGDPRSDRLREWIAEDEQIQEFAGRALPLGSREAEAHFQRVRRQYKRRMRLGSHRRRGRSRSSRQRRVRTGSVGCRSPGRPDDEDEEPSDGFLARLFARAGWRGRRAA